MTKLDPNKMYVVGHAYLDEGKTFIIKAKNKCKYWGKPGALNHCAKKTAPCRGYNFGPGIGCGIGYGELISVHDKENCPKCKVNKVTAYGQPSRNEMIDANQEGFTHADLQR